MRILAPFFILLCLGLTVSCIPGSNDNYIACTEEYRMITVSIRDADAKPVVLSSYFVKKTSTGEIIDFAKEDPVTDSILKVQGIYIICTDGKMGMTSANGTEFEFHGFSGATETINESYIIGHDQCHIKLISGKTEIVLAR